MPADIFNYSTSFLNPALKLLVPLLFLGGTYYAYRAGRRYPGEIRKLMWIMLGVGAAGFLANLFRYLGDVLAISWKWGESVVFLVLGLVNLYAAWYAASPLVKFIHQLLREARPTGGER